MTEPTTEPTVATTEPTAVETTPVSTEPTRTEISPTTTEPVAETTTTEPVGSTEPKPQSEVKLEDYDFTERSLPEDLLESYEGLDLDGLKEKCLELGVTPEQAKGLLAYHDTSVSTSYETAIGKQKEVQDASNADFNARLDKYEEELGGLDNYNRSIDSMNKLLSDRGISQEELDKDGFNQSIVGRKLVNHLLARLGEDSVATTATPQTSMGSVDAQLAELQKGGETGAYYDYNHPDHLITVQKVNALQERKLKLS